MLFWLSYSKVFIIYYINIYIICLAKKRSLHVRSNILYIPTFKQRKKIIHHCNYEKLD
jgi:hypothetical protein